MKTHDFAHQLELLAKLLRQLPDVEVSDALTSAIQSSLPGFQPEIVKATPRAPRPLPAEFEKKLVGKSPAEIEKFLGSADEAFTAVNLLELAERLGIATSKRQSKSALINLITRHFEAEQMHSIIRSTGADET